MKKENLTHHTKGVIFAGLAAFVALMLYVRTLGFGYVWDDLSYFGAFNSYQGGEGLKRAIAKPFVLSESYYRPLVLASFAFSGEPAVQHGINVLLHALNTVLVFWCARALMPREAAASRSGLVVAALGALAFAVHPVCVETVAWVSGRFDTLMCSFVLGTCLVALGGELTRRRLALAFALFFAAMCSKEAAIGLPVALPILLLLKWRLTGEEVGQRETVRRLEPLLAVLGLGAVLYVAMRLTVIQRLFAGEGVGLTFAGGGVLDKLNVAALAVTAFVKLMVNPWSHSAPLHPPSHAIDGGLYANTLIVLVSVLALLVLAALKKPRLNFPLVLLAALAMGWPVLHIIGIPQANGGNIISDRYALAPLAVLLVGLAAVAGAWLARRVPAMGAGEKRALAYAGVFCLLWTGALAAHTNVTIPMWRNEYVLWAFTHRQVPDSMLAHKRYIGTLIDQMRWREASDEMGKLWEKWPIERSRMRIGDIIDLMIVRSKNGDYEGALELARVVESQQEELQAQSPQKQGVFYGVCAMVESDAGHWGAAAHYLERAVQVSPSDLDALFRYAYALFMTGQQEKAEEVFSRALAGSTKGVAAWAQEWRKGWRLTESGNNAAPMSGSREKP